MKSACTSSTEKAFRRSPRFDVLSGNLSKAAMRVTVHAGASTDATSGTCDCPGPTLPVNIEMDPI